MSNARNSPIPPHIRIMVVRNLAEVTTPGYCPPVRGEARWGLSAPTLVGGGESYSKSLPVGFKGVGWGVGGGGRIGPVRRRPAVAFARGPPPGRELGDRRDFRVKRLQRQPTRPHISFEVGRRARTLPNAPALRSEMALVGAHSRRSRIRRPAAPQIHRMRGVIGPQAGRFGRDRPVAADNLLVLPQSIVIAWSANARRGRTGFGSNARGCAAIKTPARLVARRRRYALWRSFYMPEVRPTGEAPPPIK